MFNSRTNPSVIRVLFRRHLVLQLKVDGLNNKEIAERVRAWSIENGIAIPKNYNSDWVQKDIRTEMALVKISEKEKSKQRILENLRLDCLLKVLWHDAVYNQDLKKVDLILKIMDLRAMIWGLDAKPGQYPPISAAPKRSKR